MLVSTPSKKQESISKYSDYEIAIVENQLIFNSEKDTGGIDKGKHTWTGEDFTNLYTVQVNRERIASNPKRYDANINSKFHKATPVFTKDGNTIYFTRINYFNGQKRKRCQQSYATQNLQSQFGKQ